ALRQHRPQRDQVLPRQPRRHKRPVGLLPAHVVSRVVRAELVPVPPERSHVPPPPRVVALYLAHLRKTQTQRSPPSLPQRRGGGGGKSGRGRGRSGGRRQRTVELTLHEDFVGSSRVRAGLDSGTAENADDVMDLDQEDQDEEEEKGEEEKGEYKEEEEGDKEEEEEEGDEEEGEDEDGDYIMTEEEGDDETGEGEEYEDEEGDEEGGDEEAHNESSPVPSLSPLLLIVFHVVPEPKKSLTTTTNPPPRITTCRVTQQQHTADVEPLQELRREHSALSSSSRPHPTTQAQARGVQPECRWYVGSEWAAAAGTEGTQRARQGQADIRRRLDDRDDADGARCVVSAITTAARGDHLDVADTDDDDDDDDATQPGQDNAHRPSGVSGAAAAAATATAIAQTPGAILTAQAGVAALVIWWLVRKLLLTGGRIAHDENLLVQGVLLGDVEDVGGNE
ncbi:hypothetical protein EKO27_g12028, partial [Xylaria grammica]